MRMAASAVEVDLTMETLRWIVAGVGTAVAAYCFIDQPGLRHATGSDGVEGAAGSTSRRGSKQRVKGMGGSLLGKV